MPDDNELLTLISTHIYNMNTMFGFDTITPAFIQCAYKRVPKQLERAGKHQRACPPNRCPFQPAHYESERPQVLEKGKAHSYTQEGVSTIPGNYRMIAVSGTLYRLYANLLHSTVQDWCTHHDKTPDSQLKFVSWQKHAAPAVYPATPERCGTEDAEGLITAVNSLHWFQTSIRLHSQKQNVGPPL